MREGITKGGRNGWREGERQDGYFKGREGGEREREGGRERERERGYYNGREEGRVLQRVGWMGGWKDDDRDGRYYKGRGGGVREGGRILRIKTVISAISNRHIAMM